ncbi:RES family NAD+ phosphorylase [Paraburkholderia sp.]|uniref:RES family NAD+ phosphorylase n=1 Tax=Paraburkholderia sp. TaxID=1926495 RepID=UPI003C7EBE1B
MRIWRIATDTPAYTADDATGEGARLSGGRWNRKGTPMLYCASSISLACLETIIHLGAGEMPLNRYLVEVNVPIGLWKNRKAFDHYTAPVGWDALPVGKASLDAGDAWIASNKSLLLVVPSVIVPEDRNVLINPLHPDAGELQFKKIRKWLYDGRIKAPAT